ncbi:hypothetical protein SprV_0902665600 [Sparganum proliferum]
MQIFGCLERFTHMVRQLRDGIMARVTDNRTVSETFSMTNGVVPGCVLAPPPPVSLMFSLMLVDANSDRRPEIRTSNRTDGYLSVTGAHRLWRVYPRLLSAICSSRMIAHRDTETEAETQRSVGLSVSGRANFGLTSNTDKTVVMQPSNAYYNAPRIHENGTQLAVHSYAASKSTAKWPTGPANPARHSINC